ncbi:MAG: cupin domain-containing protein [Oscillibacter sp.]|nr:cupin domain-containing protein [Oscillibacter sp.]
MVTFSHDLPEKDVSVWHGEGLIHVKDLTDAAGLYHHGRLFTHTTVNPGCSIGYHTHEHETEFYYIIRGEAVFNDNGTEVILHPGDIGATGFGQGHGLENRGTEPVEMIALIICE